MRLRYCIFSPHYLHEDSFCETLHLSDPMPLIQCSRMQCCQYSPWHTMGMSRDILPRLDQQAEQIFLPQERQKHLAAYKLQSFASPAWGILGATDQRVRTQKTFLCLVRPGIVA